jgi:hypothetical protein
MQMEAMVEAQMEAMVIKIVFNRANALGQQKALLLCRSAFFFR